MMKVALVNITSPLGTLYQSHQITKEGNRRERNFPNLSETVEGLFESYLKAAVRGVKEELGLKVPKDRFTYVNKWREVKPSPSTNEIKGYEFCLYDLVLTELEANCCKLVADEGDCITYFEWRL